MDLNVAGRDQSAADQPNKLSKPFECWNWYLLRYFKAAFFLAVVPFQNATLPLKLCNDLVKFTPCNC
jgi:hypothetical protein